MRNSLLEVESLIETGQNDLKNGDLKGNKLHKFMRQLQTLLDKLNSEFNYLNQSCINYKNQLYRLYEEFNSGSKTISDETLPKLPPNQLFQAEDKPPIDSEYGLHLPVNSKGLDQYRLLKSKTASNQRPSFRPKNKIRRLNTEFGKSQNQTASSYNNNPFRQSTMSKLINKHRIVSTSNGKQPSRRFSRNSKRTSSKSPSRFVVTAPTGKSKFTQNTKRHSFTDENGSNMDSLIDQIKEVREKIDSMDNYLKNSVCLEQDLDLMTSQTRKKNHNGSKKRQPQHLDDLVELKEQMTSYLNSIIASKNKTIEFLDSNIQQLKMQGKDNDYYGRLNNHCYV